MVGDSTVSLLFWPKTARRSLQCVDAHYRGEERTSDLSTFLASYGQYAYTHSPKLECKTWHIHCLTFRYIFVVNYTFAVKKTKSALSLPLIFEINFLEGGMFGPHHLELWRFVSRSYAKYQLSSPVIIV